MVFFSTLFSFYFGQKITIKHIQLNALNQACRVVHLSDFHFNGLKSVEWVQKMVERINELSPDIVVVTGDLLDIDPIFLNEHITSLKEIKCSKKYVVSGNHDFYLGYELFKQFVFDINFKLLDFDSELFLRPDQKHIKVLGLPDDVATGSRVDSFFNDHIDDSPSVYHILLRHKPICFKQSVVQGIQLQLSGHTHHGQLPPFNVLVRFFFRFSHGFYRYKQGVIYTSPGTSTWGPNMRLFSSSEITVLNL